MSSKELLLVDGQAEKKGGHNKQAVINQQMIANFTTNYKGLYTLKYKKRKEAKGSTISDIEKKFAECGTVTEVDGDDWWIYLRFAVKDHAVAVLKTFGEKLNIKIVSDSYMLKDGTYERLVEVYVGNIPPVIGENELEELLSKYSPFKLKFNHISNDPGKRFRSAFVKFSHVNKSKAEELIKEIDGKMWKGKKLYAGHVKSKAERQATQKDGDEESAISATTPKSGQDASSGMMAKPLHRTSSHDSKGFPGTIPKMLPSRRETVADNDSPSSQAGKAWWKKT
ncbi:uncharacterized protein LOC110460086 [Mizuhopecten yessoensis]|uniref:RRM domain-containing protein n=1 Tax=Mizuhopecten yessoensis TaxID=6573 RepID=A0A210Q3A4_MIZYE|nr:uncharacterized protein LOC110460086 [Mizuhopecten yessoensis]XP_021368473.1 uncharacterized protein LOC110460086 [Mizuhopecten yessoensis]OWF43149.1 hypothetical protein KP79_PYT14827 [Mizuhopecten yessoensis]